MSKHCFFVSLISILIACSLSSCSNKDIKNFEGDYSYKTSGSVILTSSSDESTVVLPDRIGQLTIIDLESEDKDSVLLVFNEINGGVRYVHACINEDEIELVPYQWTTSISSVGTLDITVSGSGKRYEESIVFYEKYEGTYSTDSTDGEIKSENIKTFAERN